MPQDQPKASADTKKPSNASDNQKKAASSSCDVPGTDKISQSLLARQGNVARKPSTSSHDKKKAESSSSDVEDDDKISQSLLARQRNVARQARGKYKREATDEEEASTAAETATQVTNQQSKLAENEADENQADELPPRRAGLRRALGAVSRFPRRLKQNTPSASVFRKRRKRSKTTTD